MGTSLVVQWLRLCALTARNPGLIPGWGTKVPTFPALQPKQNKQQQQKTNKTIWRKCSCYCFCSITQFCLILCNPHRLQHARFPCPSPSPRVYSNSCPLGQCCHPTISSSVTPFSSCLLSFPASESFPVSQLFTSGGQGIGASAPAPVLPVYIQGWFPLG